MGADRAGDHRLEAGAGGLVGDRDPGDCDLREVVNAIFYRNRTGCQWRFLPHDLPSWSAVFYCFTLSRTDGLDQQIQEVFRCQAREKARRLEDPSLVAMDTQTVKTAAGVPGRTTGLHAGKQSPGRKRGLAVGTRGFTPLPKRWSVERTYGWLMFHRRLARDYESPSARSEAMLHLAMTDLMTRRLTGEATVSWRDPASQDQTPTPG